MTRVIGIDPGLSCTGIALLESGGRNSTGAFGRVVWVRSITPKKGDDIADRIDDLVDHLADILDAKPPLKDVAAVAIEFPSRGLNPNWQRSARHLPNYGILIGAIRQMLRTTMPSVVVGDAPRILKPSADEWCRGGWIPSPGNDRNKSARAAWVATTYGLDLGAKSVAGNLADAVGIAQWAAWRTQ